MGHFELTQINWRVKCVYCGLCGLTRFWHVSYRVAFGLTHLWPKPIYDPNPLRPNPNLKKPMSGSCRIHGLGRRLTPLFTMFDYLHENGKKSFSSFCFRRKCTFSPYILAFFHFSPYILILSLLVPKSINTFHFDHFR